MFLGAHSWHAAHLLVKAVAYRDAWSYDLSSPLLGIGDDAEDVASPTPAIDPWVVGNGGCTT